MKTNKTIIFAGLFILVFSGFFSSCKMPVGLGSKLDIKGPSIDFIYPNARTAVLPTFYITGSASDPGGISRVLLKAEQNNSPLAKQWRWQGVWEVSEDFGNNWAPLREVTVPSGVDAGTHYPAWSGDDKSATFKIPIDMTVGGDPDLTEDGEYLFSIQAWDHGDFTDDNSYKTRVFIIDKTPPMVDVINPQLYKVSKGSPIGSNPDLNKLHIISNTGPERTDPAYIGDFLTQAFKLQWQIEENLTIRMIDLRFYKHDEPNIDEDETTSLPSEYIFRYSKEIQPHELTSVNNVKPNGSLTVPALDGTGPIPVTGTSAEGGQWELKNPITTKTTIKVVALCYDGAGISNIPAQEKVLGYFVYWPDADIPWITFPDGMEKESKYTPASYSTETALKNAVYMIYPGRKIKATAFHAYGLKEVEYSLFEYNGGTYNPAGQYVSGRGIGQEIERKTLQNDQKPNGGYSTVFQWEFEPPAYSGYFLVRAEAVSEYNRSERYDILFRVQDITFPDFPVEPSPEAGQPLYKFIGRDGANPGSIRIYGTVSDATRIESLTMVWINPKSQNFAAMSQLQYFREGNYLGWTEAKKLTAASNSASSKKETETGVSSADPPFPYDPSQPNRLWNLALTPNGEDARHRKLFTYSVDIPLTSLNMLGGGADLTSQMFLLRAENPDGKTTIITYAPQGDVLSPKIEIEKVVVTGSSGTTTCEPGVYQPVPQFTGGEVIAIHGKWEEDSTNSLAVRDYLYNNMRVVINGIPISMENGATYPGINYASVVPSRTGTATAGSGTFEIRATVSNNGTTILDSRESYMKDTLVVSASVKDIGGNPAEVMASWLIESDSLKFLRLSSENEAQAYKEGDEIEIYMEFNKPVKLKDGRVQDPVLVLNTTGGVPGRAYYKKGQNNENVRQYFVYKVAAGQTTATFLNVEGISITGGTALTGVLPNGDNVWNPSHNTANNTEVAVDATSWTNDNYPFTWEHTPAQGDKEEVRLTRTAAHTGSKPSAYSFYAREIPVTTDTAASDYVFTLIGGKNIRVDTRAPYITGFSVAPAGWHKTGVEINITASFSKTVRLGAVVPYLTLSTGGSDPNNRTITTLPGDNIKVNNNKITFKYTVKDNDTTGTNALTVTGFGGDVLDVPGTRMTAMQGAGEAALNTTLTGVYLDTAAPSPPVVTVYNAADQGGTAIGTSGNAVVALGNLYHDAMSLRVTGTAGDQHLGTLGRVEYSLNGGQNWTTATTTNAITNIALANNGTYTVIARQTDQAGNTSQQSNPVTFNLDSGSLVSSISSINNGSFTRNAARQDVVSIQVNFRKRLSFTGTPQITLNATGNGTKTVDFTGTAAERTSVDQLTFEYNVAAGDTTGGGRLDVTALNLGAVTDGGVVVPATPTNFINVLPAAALRLNVLNEIYIVTGPMKVVTNPAQPVYTRNGTGEEWEGTIAITFDRPISKGSGDAIMQQSTAGYRLPAVLTEAQSSRYRNAAGFNTYYTRGTNGFNNGSPGSSDTSTKFVLNYEETADVTPANTNDLAKLAWDFRIAETVTIPVTSQDVTVNGSTLTITLADSNALQVLGADYVIDIPATFVQDNLGWPVESDLSYTYTTPGVNKAFIRVDKQINKDTVARTTGNGSNTNPWLTATHALTTTARLDCRTPNSVVRYVANGTSYNATGTTGTGTGLQQAGSINDWCNTDNAANSYNYGTQTDPQTNGTNYTTFTGTGTDAAGPHISVGDNNEQGYVWRITARGRNNAAGATYSAMSDEVALRTVLTVQITSMNDNLGQRPVDGDNLWIRGGDAVSSSSVPGFPLTWNDEWTSLQTEKKRAGIRLLRPVNTSGGLYTDSTWRWVSWEVNVRTYFEVSLGREATAATAPTAAAAWQYGPRLRAPQRGGWASQNDLFAMYPGKHRWIRIYQGSFTPGGQMNFSSNFISRPGIGSNAEELTVTLP